MNESELRWSEAVVTDGIVEIIGQFKPQVAAFLDVEPLIFLTYLDVSGAKAAQMMLATLPEVRIWDMSTISEAGADILQKVLPGAAARVEGVEPDGGY